MDCAPGPDQTLKLEWTLKQTQERTPGMERVLWLEQTSGLAWNIKNEYTAEIVILALWMDIMGRSSNLEARLLLTESAHSELCLADLA